MGNIVTTIITRFSSNNVASIPLRRCSDMSNGAPKLNKCTWGDNDSSLTGETASAINSSVDGFRSCCEEVDNEEMHSATCSTSRQGCLGAINNSVDGCTSLCQEVDSEQMHSATCSTSRQGCLGGGTVLISVAHTEPSVGDEVNKEGEIQNENINTEAREQGCANHSDRAGNILSERGAYDKLINSALKLDCKSTHDNSVNVEVVPSEYITSCPPIDVRDCESSPKASLKMQAKRKRSCGKSSKQMMVPNENNGISIPSDMNYPETVPSQLTRSKAKALTVSTPDSLKVRSTRSGRLTVPHLNPGNQNNISDSVPSQRTRSKAKALSVSTPEFRKPRSTSSGRLIVLDPRSQNVISDTEKLPTSPLVEQSSGNKVLQRIPRSQMFKTHLSNVRSPFTRGKAKAIPASSPESVKLGTELRSARSGRRIVPRLDPGTQNIIYDMDGSICAVTNLELQRTQGVDSEPSAKRRKRASPAQGRLLRF